jgi:NAD(P) transhydrogenase
MGGSGIELHWGERVAECNCAGREVMLTLQSGRIVHTEAVLVAAGRRSNTKCLDLAAAGLAAGERGDLKVDEHYRTAVPHIYAAGDVIGFPGLASTGMQQARRAMSVAFGGADSLPAHDILPSAVYTIPEVAMAGNTEQAVHAAGVDYVVGRARYTDRKETSRLQNEAKDLLDRGEAAVEKAKVQVEGSIEKKVHLYRAAAR